MDFWSTPRTPALAQPEKPRMGSKANLFLKSSSRSSSKEGPTPLTGIQRSLWIWFLQQHDYSKDIKGCEFIKRVSHQEVTSFAWSLHAGCYGALRKCFSLPQGGTGQRWRASLPLWLHRWRQGLLLPAWEHKASIQMSFSWNVFVLKGLGAQEKG